MYALLLVHTFLSIRCFSQIIDPHDRQQQAVDLLLVVSYFALAQWQSGIPFLSAWVVLFAFATLKYALLVGRSSHTRLLRRKLVADIGGLGLGMFTMFSGSLPLMFAVFAAASVYYLVLNPLYVLDTV
ncbi:MAG TPA: hypothetical protein VMU11_02135 [Verrucomicrobiae bacterium]|nr:hypothetical protein [Verrucomicrobiae bacterium]